jgi:heptaprenyl diphosphate synthase
MSGTSTDNMNVIYEHFTDKPCDTWAYSDNVNVHERLGLPHVEQDLQRLEVLLSESVVVGDPHLDQITTHLIHAGGKRLRPLLAVSSATGGQRSGTTDDLMGGIAVELMHLASLYHDDVMDEAEIRRNVDSVNARYGNLVAIVAGDYLMARSAAIAADLGVEIAGLLARTLAWLTRGQVAEVRTAFDISRSLDDYYVAIEGKTASLMAASCRVGALTAQRPLSEVDALEEFGRCFGMVYQLRDDILDMTATDGQLGKPAGQDLAEGIYTLPALHALHDAQVRTELSELLGRPLDDAERERARKLVVSTDAIAATYTAAATYLDQGTAALQSLPDVELRQGFTSLLQGLLEGLPEA